MDQNATPTPTPVVKGTNLARPMVLVGKISDIRRHMHLANHWLYLRELGPLADENGFWLVFSQKVTKNLSANV
jgi:hypothetical protein